MCSPCQKNKKAMKSFDFTASTLDIPSRWDPRAKQSRTVALLAALCAAALFEPLAMCRKCAKVCRAKISPAKQAVSHSPKSWISTVFITHNLPVLSRQQSYITHRLYGRV